MRCSWVPMSCCKTSIWLSGSRARSEGAECVEIQLSTLSRKQTRFLRCPLRVGDVNIEREQQPAVIGGGALRTHGNLGCVTHETLLVQALHCHVPCTGPAQTNAADHPLCGDERSIKRVNHSIRNAPMLVSTVSGMRSLLSLMPRWSCSHCIRLAAFLVSSGPSSTWSACSCCLD